MKALSSITNRALLRSLILLTLLMAAISALAQVEVSTLEIDKQGVISYGKFRGTVTLNQVPTIGTRVKLFSSDPVVKMPKFVKLQAGQTTTSFTITGLPVTDRTWTTISAAITKDFIRKRVYVEPPAHATVNLVHNWVIGGSLTWGTLDVYTKAPAGGITVALESSNPDAVSVPASVKIPKNKTNIEFEVQTHAVTQRQTVNITGTVFGYTFVVPIDVRPEIAGDGWYPIGTNPNMLNNGGKKPSVIVTGATTKITTRMLHYAAKANLSDTPKIRLVYANYDTEENSGERTPPNPITVKAAIEKQSVNGPNVEDVTPVPVTFNGGQATVTIQPGDYAVSDPVTINFNNGRKFYTRTCQIVDNSNQVMCGGLSTLGSTALGGFDNGEGMIAGDLAYGGYIPPSAKKGGYSPSAILGYSSTPITTLGLCGDSILTGAGDGGYRFAAGSFAERVPTLQFGLAENPAKKPLCGYVHVAKGAEKAETFITSRIRFELTCLSDTVVTNYINNDIGDYDEKNYTEYQIKANIVKMIKRWTVRGKRVVFCTCNPKVQSTDGFWTVGGQTPEPEEWLRVKLNNWIRDPQGLTATVGAPEGKLVIWDICIPVEVNGDDVPTLNGGRWKADPTVFDTGSITTLAYLSPPSFRDKDKSWPANQLAGMTVTFTSGPNKDRTRVIAYNDNTGHIVLRGGYSALSHLGDTYSITTGVFSTDGTHPTSLGHGLIASSFPYQTIFGANAP